MNSASTFIVWLQLIGLLACEAALVVGGGVVLDRFTRSAAWRRTLWQVCLLSLLLLPICELSGMARLWADWLARKTAPRRSDAISGVGRDVAFRLTDEFRAEVADRAART